MSVENKRFTNQNTVKIKQIVSGKNLLIINYASKDLQTIKENYEDV